ncbi:nuclear transport factor 2 family protein [Mycolicibacterium austroafricanum]|uniref:nuclear transport factor 2 family protein n=1 Tax=Mycolicibacterium austroafricanum TaxID=39687 RepID=UPI001CA30443|nr:nuclear transport factor 2 family protein [Mycolicibacterium austroafricanum]QZT62240.1 nuclear transport factor 2 family protein [Mycolicibacterium austroafricanum]
MRDWPAKLIAAIGGLLATGFVALSAVGGALYWNRVELNGEEQARAELPSLAAQQIPLVFGFDYQTVERTFAEVYPLLTPEYRKEFQDRVTNEIIPQARDRQLISQAHSVGAGILDAHRNSASVMVYMNRTVTDKAKESVYDGSRLRVDYKKVDGKWLIAYITPI